MAQHKNRSFIKKVLIIGGLIISLQLYLLWSLGQRSEEAITLQDYVKSDQIRSSVSQSENMGLSETDQKYAEELLKVKLALTDFRLKHSKYPDDLEELVPSYFTALPIDPKTNEVIAYQKLEDTYRIGPSVSYATPTPEEDFIDEDDSDNSIVIPLE